MGNHEKLFYYIPFISFLGAQKCKNVNQFFWNKIFFQVFFQFLVIFELLLRRAKLLPKKFERISLKCNEIIHKNVFLPYITEIVYLLLFRKFLFYLNGLEMTERLCLTNLYSIF